KGVEGWVLCDDQIQLLVFEVAVSCQLRNQPLKVINQDRIRGRGNLTAIQSQPLLSKQTLLHRGNHAGTGIAQQWQIVRVGAGTGSGDQGGQGNQNRVEQAHSAETPGWWAL